MVYFTARAWLISFFKYFLSFNLTSFLISFNLAIFLDNILYYNYRGTEIENY